MSIVVKTIPLEKQTFFYIQCSSCGRDRMINILSAAPNTINNEKYKKLCGCVCEEEVKEVKEEVSTQSTKRKTVTAIIQGKEMTVKEIAEAFDLNPSTIRNRIRAGKSEEEIIASTKK